MLGRLTTAATASLVSLACSASAPSDAGDATEGTDDALTAATSGKPAKVNLLYEGTCDFLHQCSSFSKKLPEGQVQFGCGGPLECNDDDLWVAGPTHAQCNKHVRFCIGDACVVALVRDVSVAQKWEASNGVLDRLGLPHDVTGKCSGTGGGTVTATFPVPAPEPEPVRDAGSTGANDALDP